MAEALRRSPAEARQRHFIRRTKEEMVDLAGNPLYRQRECRTFTFDLTDGEEALYHHTTAYLREHYNRALRNRPAAQLAMSVFQRRLASSTSALLRSFERRIDKLERDVADWQSGNLDEARLGRRERLLATRHREDFFDTHGADEDVREDGVTPGERSEDFEDAVLGAVTTVTIEELRREIEVLQGLRARARALIDAGDESKFEKLREVLEDPLYARDKWLIFSEHRDTVDFLVRRIEGLGYSEQVAVIHGGMGWPEREKQVERFREPNGARFLVATDAAGEGINLQFCRVMVNYDIPWNPARLEQRMGRIHRYGQKQDVRVVNLVAGGTHEGRLRIRRPGAGEACIWLHPGEPVFDALRSRVIEVFSHHARRGAIFIDSRADEAGLWHLAALSVEEDAPGVALSGESTSPGREASRHIVDSRLLTVRQESDEALTEHPLDALLLLQGAPDIAPGSVPLASRASALKADASVHVERRLSEVVEEHRTARRAELPERRRRINVSFDLQSAALAKRCSELTRAVARANTRGRPGDSTEQDLAVLKREQATLSEARGSILRELNCALDRIGAGPPRFLAHVLALPPSPDRDIEQMDERVEAMAVRIAAQAEVDRGAKVRDVSTPEKARAAGLADWPGFDLLSRGSDGEVRSIEVKARAGRSAVRMELNEWKQACNLGERYWLCVVFACATPTPRLYRVQDPFRRLLATEHSVSAFTIAVRKIVEAAVAESLSHGRAS